MTIHEFIELSANQQIDVPFVDKLKQLYSTELTGQIAKLVSAKPLGESLEADDILRLMSNEEILNASEDLDVDFVEIMLLPLLDTGDNDYIAFDLKNDNWCMFNIADAIKFKQRESFEEFFMEE